MLKTHPVTRVIPLRNAEYYTYMSTAIAKANKRVWVSQFSVNIKYMEDDRMLVRQLLKLIKKVYGNGIDIKILVGTKSTSVDLVNLANKISGTFLTKMKVPCRHFFDFKKDSSHSKFVVIDDEIIVLGSHNWSPRAFSKGIDDSIAIHSKEINKELSSIFIANWNKSQSI